MSVKFGIRLRSNWLEDRSESNYGGTFIFAGFTADKRIRLIRTLMVLFHRSSNIAQKLLGTTDTRYNPNQFTYYGGKSAWRMFRKPMSDCLSAMIGA